METARLVFVFAVLASFFSAPCYAASTSDSPAYSAEYRLGTARKLDKDIRAGRMNEAFATALEASITTAVGELAARGYWDQAEMIRGQWDNTFRNTFFSARDIKDHPEAIAWLKVVHDTVEGLIGIDVCRATHFHSLYIWNKAFPVVLNPCSVTPDEYQKCFSGKIETEVEWGAISEVDYWLTYAVVAGATMGTGFVFISGFVASVSEFGFCHLLGGPLSQFVWGDKCL